MEVIKATSNMEFDVIYADGTRRHVEEGVLYEVDDGEIIFHKGTSRPEVIIAAAEGVLKYLKHIDPGLKALAVGMCLNQESREALWELVVYGLHMMDPDERPVKQAIFRLGQMDMKESIIDMLQANVETTAGLTRAVLQAAIDELRKMEVPNGQSPEDKSHAIPGVVPGIRFVDDFERCDDLQQLRFVMENINRNQYTLISVTQDSEDVFTVFFRRMVLWHGGVAH